MHSVSRVTAGRGAGWEGVGGASEGRLLKTVARLSSELTLLFTLPDGPLLQEQRGATLRSKKKSLKKKKRNERRRKKQYVTYLVC